MDRIGEALSLLEKEAREREESGDLVRDLYSVFMELELQLGEMFLAIREGEKHD